MGIVRFARLIPRGVILAGMLAASCGRAPLTEIGDGWLVDEGLPQKPAAHLYREVEGTRVLVDRQIESYRLYANRCLMYESARPEGRYVFVVWGRLKPLAITKSDAFERWRMDADGLRRFAKPLDTDGRSRLSVTLMKYGEICYNAQLQPPFQDDGTPGAPFKYMHMKTEESVIEVNGTDSVGNSVLSDAAREGQVTLVDELLRAGADVNSANDAGITVLMSAVSGRHLDVARRLIKGGARIDAQDDRGQTALMTAARYRNPEMARLLVEAGADLKIRDDSGKDVLSWVPDGGGPETQQLRQQLEQAAAHK
jgi:hypothetical protein